MMSSAPTTATAIAFFPASRAGATKPRSTTPPTTSPARAASPRHRATATTATANATPRIHNGVCRSIPAYE